jgi:VanZ family protein
MDTRRLFSILAWAMLAFIAFATLLPYSLRPGLSETEPPIVVMVERVGAFAVLGLLFLVSYPDRTRTVCLLVFGSAAVLEIGQAFLPGRHARIVDVLEKVVGGGAGMLLGFALLPALIGARGLLTRIDRRWFSSNMVEADREARELVVGFLIIMAIAVMLVSLQNLGP